MQVGRTASTGDLAWTAATADGQGGARHDVIETLRQNDRSVERTADYLEVPLDRIEACLRYYADYGDEIDQWIDRARAIAEREEARWHRRGEALA
jgi:uncharacterized protein (DUF433 family)